MEGQCGVEASVVVTRPTPVLELHDCPVSSLHAGVMFSGAVSAQGDAWTWGDGKCGKLGHGTSDPVFAPSRVRRGCRGPGAGSGGRCHPSWHGNHVLGHVRPWGWDPRGMPIRGT